MKKRNFLRRLPALLFTVALTVSCLVPAQSGKASEILSDEHGEYERLQGSGVWWSGEDRSRNYELSGDTPVTLTITPHRNTELCVEVEQQDRGLFITTCSGLDEYAWYYGDVTADDLQYIPGEAYDWETGQLLAGHEYEVTVTRTDSDHQTSDYCFEYRDKTRDEDYLTYTAPGTNLTGNTIVRIICQAGSMDLRTGAEYQEGTGGQKPGQDDGTIRHGTDRTRLVSESQLKNDPPADYKIPDGLVREAKDKKYADYFPKDSIQTVSIDIPEDHLNYMLQHAVEKPTVMTNSVTVGDTTVKYAGFKTKGNYTLNETNLSTSDRFSFTINFGKYIRKKQYGKKQNFYGCDKISFNNGFFEKTYMKEYNAFRLMDEMGLPTPEYSVAKLYINGKYYGIYFMVEAMDNAILERYLNTGKTSDFLTKPSYTKLTYNFEDELERCLDKNGEFTMDALSENGLLTLDKNSGTYAVDGALLNYSPLWENENDTLQDVAEMLPTALTWNRRIQLLSDGKDFDGKNINVNSDRYVELLNTVMDTDETVKYFATHSFIIQTDNMFTFGQNYGLYIDETGKSMMVPWDYDLAWGCHFQPNDAESVANWDIQRMYPDDFENYYLMSEDEVYRLAPVFHVIYQNKKLMEKFRTYISDCPKIAALGGTTSDGKTYRPGRFAETIATYYPQICAAADTRGLADNVYYLNGYEQPRGARDGIPVLKKIIAMRSVGVWLQTNGMDANVTGYGCDLNKLGNGLTGWPSTAGILTAVHEDTGIFATAKYGAGTGGPRLTVKTVAPDDSLFQKARSAVGKELAAVYQITNGKKPNSNYTLYIPLAPGYKNVRLYSYSEKTGACTPLKTTAYGSIYCATTPDISCIAAAVNDTPAGGTQGGVSPGGTQGGNNPGSNAGKAPSVPKILSLKNTGKRKMTLKWKKVSAADGYQIRYAANKKMKGKKSIRIKKKKTVKRVITGLKKGNTYFVQIRSYKNSSGKKTVSKWSGKKSVKIRK